jgi:hypothetical protein
MIRIRLEPTRVILSFSKVRRRIRIMILFLIQDSKNLYFLKDIDKKQLPFTALFLGQYLNYAFETKGH